MMRTGIILLNVWLLRNLGFSGTELSKKYGVSQPSVNISIKRGARIAQSVQLELVEELWLFGRIVTAAHG
jgi:hypothetical protein